MDPITTIKKAIAECGPLNLFQITKETGLSCITASVFLDHESFYSFSNGGVTLYSLAF